MKQQRKESESVARLKLHDCKYHVPPMPRDSCFNFNHSASDPTQLASSPLHSQISASACVIPAPASFNASAASIPNLPLKYSRTKACPTMSWLRAAHRSKVDFALPWIALR